VIDDEGGAGFGQIDEESVLDAAFTDGMFEAKAHVGAVLRPQNVARCAVDEFSCSFSHS
jgi:hypothetical protein